jgi:hypothetical protein
LVFFVVVDLASSAPFLAFFLSVDFAGLSFDTDLLDLAGDFAIFLDFNFPTNNNVYFFVKN